MAKIKIDKEHAKDQIRILKKFSKNPVKYVANKASCLKEARKRGMSNEDARSFCRLGSGSKKRQKSAGKIKAVSPSKEIRRS